MYLPLSVHPSAPERIKRFVADHVDMQFSDVHCMLRLPMSRYGLRAGCNFAAATCLLGLIAGASVVLYEPDEFWNNQHRDLLFKMVLETYPWLRQRPAMGPVETIVKLWQMYRNPFAHSLGITRPGREMFEVIKFKGGLSERQVEALESPGPRPGWLPPTMIKQKNTIKLHVDALYWGTRRMVEALTADAPRMTRTDRLLSDLGKGVQRPVPSSIPVKAPCTVVSSSAAVVTPQMFRVAGPTE
jgi:hypothetical protein